MVEFLIWGFSQRQDYIFDRLPNELLYLYVILRHSVGSINVGHEVDEQVRYLVDELQGLVVLEYDLLSFLLLIFLPLIKRLPLVNLELLTFRVIT